MAKKTKIQKLGSIEEQIKALQEKKKDVERQIHLTVGKELFEHWEVEDEEQAIEFIKMFADQVNGSLNKETNSSEEVENVREIERT